jgi:hypothetical protein
MVALESGPIGINQKSTESEESQKRINPPRVAPGCLAETATL